MKMSHEERSLCLVDQPMYGGETRTEGCCADQRKLNVNQCSGRRPFGHPATCHKHEAHFSPRLGARLSVLARKHKHLSTSWPRPETQKLLW